MKDPEVMQKHLHCPLLVGCSLGCKYHTSILFDDFKRCFLLITPMFCMVTPNMFHLFTAIKAESNVMIDRWTLSAVWAGIQDILASPFVQQEEVETHRSALFVSLH